LRNFLYSPVISSFLLPFFRFTTDNTFTCSETFSFPTPAQENELSVWEQTYTPCSCFICGNLHGRSSSLEIPLDGWSVTSFPNKRIKQNRRGNEKRVRSFIPYTDASCYWLAYIILAWSKTSGLNLSYRLSSITCSFSIFPRFLLLPWRKWASYYVVHVVESNRQIQLLCKAEVFPVIY
jgi:hypothetical protein